jgi:hypothetical protein
MTGTTTIRSSVLWGPANRGQGLSAEFAMLLNYVCAGVLPHGKSGVELLDAFLLRGSSRASQSDVERKLAPILAARDAKAAGAMLCLEMGISPQGALARGRIKGIVRDLAARRAAEIARAAKSLLVEAEHLAALAGKS